MSKRITTPGSKTPIDVAGISSAIFQIASDAIIVIDEAQNIVFFNQGAEKIFMYEAAEVTGKALELLLPDAFHKTHRAEVEKFADARVPARLKDQRRKIAGRRKNGEVFPGEASITRIVFEGKTYFAAIFRDITEEERREKQVGLQLAMTRAIAEADCFESALSVSLQMVCEITGWDFGEVWLPAPDGQRLQAGSSYCRPDQDLENFRELSRDFKFEMNVGLPGQVWATRKPVWIPDVTVDANFPRVPHARAAGLRAAAGIPILAGERVVAVLDFFLRAERREDENFVALVSSVAAELGAVFARRQAENALRVQEARFRALIENASDAIALISADGTILYESSGVAHVLGYAVGERTGQTFFELIHPDDQPDVNNRFAQLLQQPGLTISTQLRYRHKDGSWRWLEATGQNLLAEPGVQAIVANYRDITERRRAQIASNLLQTTALAIAEATDFNSALDAALRTLCEATGWKYAEAWVPRADAGVLELGQVWYGGGEQVEKFRSASKGFTFRPGEGLPGRVWATKAPEWIPDVSVNGELFRRASQALEAGLRAGMGVPIIGNGDVLVVAFFMFESRPEDRNIMDVALSIGNQLGTMLLRKRAEENLRQSEEKFRNLTETLPIGIGVTTPEGRIIEANPALVKMTGYDSKEEFMQAPAVIHYHNPQDRQRYIAQLLEHGKISGFELQLQRKDGSIYWASVSSVTQKRPDGSIVFVHSVENIAERKRAEAETHLLQVLTKAVTESESFDAALSLALNLVCETTGWDFGEVWLLSQDGAHLELGSSHYGLEGYRSISQGFKFALGVGLPGRVWKSGQPEWIPDVSLDANFPRAEFAAEAGLKAAVGIPILAGNAIVAVMNFFLKEARQEDERTVMLVSTVAAQLGTAFQRKQDEENIRQRLGELEVLYESGLAISQLLRPKVIAQKIIDLLDQKLNWHHSTIRLYHPQDETLELLAFNQPGIKSEQERNALEERFNASISNKGQGLSGWAVEHEQSVRTSDLPHDPRYLETIPGLQSGLYVPIKIAERVIGVVGIESEEANAFSEADERLVATLAAQAASALENARLFEETEQRLEHLQSLHAIDKAITGSMDISLILEVIIGQVISQLNADAVVILLYDQTAKALKYAKGSGFRTEALQHTRLPLGDGYAGRVALGRQMVQIPDLQTRKTDFLRSPTFLQEGFVSYFGVPLIANGEIKGVLEVFHRAAFEAETDWLNFLEALAVQTAIAIDNATLFKNLQLSNVELSMAYDATIAGWSRAMDLRDKETEGHTQRVTEMTMQLAREMNINDAEIIHIRRGALLHDIGKMGVPDGILFKPDKLTDEEWVLMKKHPQFAYNMLFPITYLKPALDIPYCHHEKWDGTGYPRGLKGEQIPLAARLFAFADVYDALTSDRPYRAAWTKAKTLEYIREQSGKQFDPGLVSIFLSVIEEYEAGSI